MSTNKLILAGQKLSNICYNMKQNDTLPQHVRDSMEECVKEWDEAYKAYHKALSEIKESNNAEAFSLGKYIVENLK